MRKKFLATLATGVMFLGNTALAAQLSQPEKAGTIIAANIGGFAFRDGIYNEGILDKNNRRNKDRNYVYTSGIARIGNGVEAVYFHYRTGDYRRNIPQIMAFGDRENMNNTIPITLMAADVFKIQRDEKFSLYLIHDEEERYILIGRKSDGQWVKYFNRRYQGKILGHRKSDRF